MELNIDVDVDQLNDLRGIFQLTEKQFEASLKRAVKRTAGSARSEVSKKKLGLSDLRRTTAIRRRIKPLLRTKGDALAIGIWIGINDLWATEFKGRPRRTPTGIDFRGEHFKDAFLVKFPGSRRNVIVRKKADGTLEKVTIPIAERAIDFLEKEVLPGLPDRLYHHFRTDVEFRKQIGNFYRVPR